MNLKKIKKKIKDFIQEIFYKLKIGNLPEFIILGGQKCGTTSLHYYLSKHPSLKGSNPKEVRFFSKDKNFKKGENWYKSKMVNFSFKRRIFFEATPENLYYPDIPEKISKIFKNKKIKFIVLYRDPIKRAYSAWNMYRDFPNKFGKIPDSIERNSYLYKFFYNSSKFPSFKETVDYELQLIENNSDINEPSIIRRGIYINQINRYLNYFQKENILIVNFDDLKNHRNIVLNNVCEFLKIKKISWDSILNNEIKNKREYSTFIEEETEQKLINFYQPYNKALNEFLKNDYNQ